MTNGSNEPAGYGQINFSVVVSHQHLAKKVIEKNVRAQWILRWQPELVGPLWSAGISLQHPCECLSRCDVPTTPSTGRSSTDANQINQERVNRDETECCVPAVFNTDLLINAFVCLFFKWNTMSIHQSNFTHKRVCEKKIARGFIFLTDATDEQCAQWRRTGLWRSPDIQCHIQKCLKAHCTIIEKTNRSLQSSIEWQRPGKPPLWEEN